jgi:hypothetical protein
MLFLFIFIIWTKIKMRNKRKMFIIDLYKYIYKKGEIMNHHFRKQNNKSNCFYRVFFLLYREIRFSLYDINL